MPTPRRSRVRAMRTASGGCFGCQGRRTRELRLGG
jgi:hypothetical protein